jgi:RNA polymerase-binding protein DksA
MALSKEQTRELHGLIERRREALLAEIRDDLDRVRRDDHAQLAGASPDPGDESVAALIADLEHADVSRDVGELRGLEAARERLKDGSYGICKDCGAEIEFARLRANPGAERCIDCQRRHEKTYASPSGPTL